MQSYGKTLKSLIDFTGIKFSFLANELNYDASYISKWCCGIKLPLQKHIETINRQLGRIFAAEILSRKLGLDFFKKFSLNLPENIELLNDPSFLEDKIYLILKKAFHSSNSQGAPAPVTGYSQIVIGNSEIKNFLRDILKKETLSRDSSFSTILITMNISSRDVELLIDLLKNSSDSITIKIGLDVEEFRVLDLEKISYIYRILNHAPNLNIEIYSDAEFKNYNLIVARNKFLINYSLDRNNSWQLLNYCDNGEYTEKVFRTLSQTFAKSEILLKPVESRKMIHSRYRMDFYSDGSFNMLPVHGFEFLLPKAVILDIAKKAFEETGSEEIMLSIIRLQIEWEEIFNDKSINFFLIKSSFYKYIENGELLYMDTKYKLSIEQRLAHFEYAMQILKKNPKIKVYLLDEEKMKTNFENFNIGIYLNPKKFFIKNIYNIFNRKEPAYRIGIQENMVKMLNQFMENLKHRSFCMECSVDFIEKKWNESKNMLIKIMEIEHNLSKD